MFKRKLLSFALLVVGTGIAVSLATALDAEERSKPDADAVVHAEVFSQLLPKGDYRKVSCITVAYAPGAESPKHRHGVAVFAYVLPGTVHLISRNASKTGRAKLLVFFVEEEGKTPTTVINLMPASDV